MYMVCGQSKGTCVSVYFITNVGSRLVVVPTTRDIAQANYDYEGYLLVGI